MVHYTYPNKGSQAVSKADVKSALADLDVRFTDTADREAVILEHQHEVASSDFGEFTRMLRARLEFLGWEYDGWDCAVEVDG